MAPFYETIDSIRETLSEGHVSIDVHKYEKDEKSLMLIDSLERYIDKDNGQKAFDNESLCKANGQIVEYATNKLNKNGTSIMGDVGAYLFKNQIQSLVDYELCLPCEFDQNLKGICLYHQRDFDRLSEETIEKLIEHHKIVIKI